MKVITCGDYFQLY